MVHSRLVATLLLIFIFNRGALAQVPDFNSLEFQTRQIDKIIISVPKNQDAPWKQGIFENEETELKEHSILDKRKLMLVEKSLFEICRLHTHGTIGPNRRNGRIEIFCGDKRVSIGIWTNGFVLGDGYPNDQSLFTNWTLAKLIDVEANAISPAGLKRSSFDVLSGEYRLNKLKSLFRKSLPEYEGKIDQPKEPGVKDDGQTKVSGGINRGHSTLW